ncbi:MAG: RHS domain-containing protein [Nitrospirae bacterium]|nr:RHS domain-containing protein [Nitrospirota bacterium]
MKGKILVLLSCLLFAVFTFYAPAEAGSFSAELGEDGIVTLSGSEGFECVPEGVNAGSWANIWLNFEAFDFASSASNTITIDKQYNFSCRKPGRYTFSVLYSGYNWSVDLYGTRACKYIFDSSKLESTIHLPLGREIEIKVQDDMGDILNDYVKRGRKIIISYNFTYSNDLENYNRTLSVAVDNQTIYSEGNHPLSGSIEIPYDFSNKKGFVLLKVYTWCVSAGSIHEKLVYIEPEDSCPVNVGKPVSVASGNVYASETDFTLKGKMPISFTRYYDSAETTMRGFGQGWGHTFDTRAIKFPNSAGNTYKVINPDGSDVYYIDNDGDGVYDVEFPKGEKSRLLKNTDNTFVREFFDGSKEEFNASGYLTSVIDRNGNRITLTRGTNNKLTQITDPYGRTITVSYNPSSSTKITSITLPDGNTINYAYGTYLNKVTYPDNSYRDYEYVFKTGAGWRLSGIKNENGLYIEKHDYDAQGRATTSSSDGTNEKLTINYLSDTQSIVTDSLGSVTTYTIDKTLGVSHPTNISGPGCKECGQGDTSRTYDNNRNVTSTTDANANVTTMTYDANGNMLTKTEAYGTVDDRTTTYTYNSLGQVLTEMDDDGIITGYSYDTSGNMLTKTEAHGTTDERTTAYTYNAYGQVLTTTDPNGRTTTNTYDQYGNLASVTNALNQTITYTYDIIGNLLSVTDANGNTTVYEYDLRDRLIRETKPDGGVINYEYDAAGNRTAVTDADGHRTIFTYDTINRLTRTTDAAGSSTNYTYDAEGNMTSMIIRDDLNNIITLESYTYDGHNRLTRTTHADGTNTEQGHDALGNVLTKRDENGNVTTNAYDALNRLVSVTDTNSGVTSYTYDKRNNLTSITDANGNVTTYTYDNLNRLISNTSPDTGTTTYTFDASGNMITKTDANGTATTYAYDALNRQTATQFPDSIQNIAYTYDNCLNGKGRLCMMTDPSGTTWYDYDKMGRVTKETRKVNNIIYRTEYTYDLNGNVLTITYPGGRMITYTYNQLNKVVSIAETYLGVTRTLVSNISYQPFGDIVSMMYGNGIVTTKAYDNRNLLNSLSIGMLKQFSYSRDSNGNITAITDVLNPSQSKAYTYDPLNRLANAAGSWGSLNYSYDGVGNRQTETTSTGSSSYSYTANKLTSVLGEKTFNFSYDNNGSTVSENSRQFIYNQNQRLTRVTDTGAVLAEYIYNSKGQRIKKCAGNVTPCTVYHYDRDGLLIAETTDTGIITSEYVYLNGQPLAKIEGTISGAAYNSPDPMYPLFRASLSVNIKTSSLLTGVLKYYYTLKRLSLASTSITGLSFAGNIVTVTGVGTTSKITGRVSEAISGCTFTARITDGSPDAMAIEIRKPDGTLYYSAVPKTVASGNYNVDGNNIYYYHNDHLGTPVVMTDSSGSTVWQGEFKPFGEPLSISGSVTNNLRFPGQYYDSETGLHQNWHRDYMPEVGRYVESDPILQPMISKPIKSSCSKSTVTWRVPMLLRNPQDLLPYLYTKGNPVIFTDLTGLVCGSGWSEIFPDKWPTYNFTGCCQTHDDCYGCKGKAQGLSKAACDQDFCSCSLEECERLDGDSRRSCEGNAKAYCWAVRRFGNTAFDKARKCCK